MQIGCLDESFEILSLGIDQFHCYTSDIRAALIQIRDEIETQNQAAFSQITKEMRNLERLGGAPVTVPDNDDDQARMEEEIARFEAEERLANTKQKLARLRDRASRGFPIDDEVGSDSYK